MKWAFVGGPAGIPHFPVPGSAPRSHWGVTSWLCGEQATGHMWCAVHSDSLRPCLPCTAMVPWKPVPPGKAYPKLKWATALHFPNLSDWFFMMELKETQDLCIIIVWSCLFLFFFLSWCGKKTKSNPSWVWILHPDELKIMRTTWKLSQSLSKSVSEAWHFCQTLCELFFCK